VYCVTGSSGRLGFALCDKLAAQGGSVVVRGVDPVKGRYTTHHPDEVEALFDSVDCVDSRIVVFHCGALHKPHVKNHSEEQFLTANVAFTMRLLQCCKKLKKAMVIAFVFTSTTSVFGHLFQESSSGSSTPALWIDEDTDTSPKNIYGWSKVSAENLVKLYAARGDVAEARFGVLRACRFFPEDDDREATAAEDGILDEDNLKFVHTLSGRRLSLRDVVDAHLAFVTSPNAGRFVICNLGNEVALRPGDCTALGEVGTCERILLSRYGDRLAQVLKSRSWKLPHRVDRIYDASKSFSVLQWRPKDTPFTLMESLEQGLAIDW
jgi:UDP-glucose 4-epimerase